MEAFYEFEKPIVLLEKKLADLRQLSKDEGMDFKNEILSLEKKVAKLIDDTYSNLSPWQLVQVSRHPNRPYTRDFVDALFTDFMDLAGDRTYAEDCAILGGTAMWDMGGGTGKVPVMILGHQKGRSTKQKMERNFGMAKPEGYRKAMRLLELASRTQMPVVTFIDTPGAYPGLEAEERGQSQAIAESIRMMFGIKVPVVSIVIGEGGSGGALAIGIADRVLMMEYSTYSVISPESCASILWNDSGLAERAAEKLKMNPKELLALGVVDAIIPEPMGGAQRDWTTTFENTRKALVKNLNPLLRAQSKASNTKKLLADRHAKFREMGESAFTQVRARSEDRSQ